MTESDVKQIIHQLETTYPEGSEIAMTMADKWREEGWEKGLAQGLEKGKSDALARTAIHLLTERFGKLPQDMKDAITKSDITSLQLLLSNIFRYETLEDVNKYL